MQVARCVAACLSCDPILCNISCHGAFATAIQNWLQYKEGDRVFGLAPWYSLSFTEGTYCEIVSAKEEWLALVPTRLPLHEAGQVPLVSLTAWQVRLSDPGECRSMTTPDAATYTCLVVVSSHCTCCRSFLTGRALLPEPSSLHCCVLLQQLMINSSHRHYRTGTFSLAAESSCMQDPAELALGLYRLPRFATSAMEVAYATCVHPPNSTGASIRAFS